MEKQNRYGNHTVSRLTAHIVWVTKYRYKVLELIIQICDIKVLGGVVSKDHMEYPLKISKE